jgi:DNA-binding NarL/FixJ family response regulator
LSREATGAALDEAPDLLVVGEAETGLQAVAAVERLRPAVAVLQGNLRDTDALQTTYLIRVSAPRCRVVVLTDVGDADRAVEALEAGASGLVTSGSSLAHLIEAVRAVHRGEAVLPCEIVSGVLRRLMHVRLVDDEARRRLGRLTRRDRTVLTLFAQGESTESIARQLDISQDAARDHVRDLLGKLGVLAGIRSPEPVTGRGPMRRFHRVGA